MISKKFLSQLIWLPVLAAPLAALAAPAYTVAFAPSGFDIGASRQSRLNNMGQILGSSGGVPAIWYGARVKTFPALVEHYALGINNRGDFVGGSATGPFIHTASGVRYFSVTQDGGGGDWATALNDARGVIGSTSSNLMLQRGFLHSRRGTAFFALADPSNEAQPLC